MNRPSTVQKDKKKRKKSKKQAVLLLAAITAAIWILLVLIKVVVFFYLGRPIGLAEIFDGILDNILGILPPIILIDFAFEYVTQDYITDEISEQITATLMSNPDAISLFDDDVKRNFINTTISTITTHGEDEAQMAISALTPYIKSNYNLKKHFDYSITLWDYPMKAIFDSSQYMMISETLRFERHYLSAEILSSTFKIGFFVQNSDLDKNLRKNEFLLRESLSIHDADLKKLIHLPQQEKDNFVVNEMALKVFVDHIPCRVISISITDIGIEVELSSSHDRSKNSVYIDAAFCIPQMKGHTTFLASITEPTFGANIRFSYPRNLYKVTMFPFFNDLDDALVEESDRGVGTCDVHILNKWVYPMSGVVFDIDLQETEPQKRFDQKQDAPPAGKEGLVS